MTFSHANVTRFKFFNDIKKLNVLFIETQKLINFEQTIFDIFLNAFDENSQLRTKNKKVDNLFNIVIETQLQI